MPEHERKALAIGMLLGAACMVLGGAAMADQDDLVWSTFLGGSNIDNGADIALDGAGHVWVTGFAESMDFPTTPGAFDTVVADREVFVARFDPDGEHLQVSTLLGGANREEGYSLSLDGMGNVYIAGYTRSTDFPLTPGALDTTLEGYSDAFVVKLDPAGQVVYATLLGGSNDEWCYQIAAGDSGRVTAVGSTGSIDFPVTPGSADQTHNGASDAFVARLHPSGGALEYAAFLGGSSDEWGWGVALDDSGCAYVTGYTSSRDFPTTPGVFDSTHMGPTDVFVARFEPQGTSLRYATLLGGGSRDAARSIAVDAQGNASVTGYTYSSDFPVTPGAFQDSMSLFGVSAFVTRLDPRGGDLVYSTFLTGDGTESGYGITVDDSGRTWVTGFTESEDFPVTAGSFDETHNGERDIFLCGLDAAGSSLRYSTFLGGADDDYAWDLVLGNNERIYLGGYSRSQNYPATPGAFQESPGGLDDTVIATLVPGGLVPVEQRPSEEVLPGHLSLIENWPNPFNASTTIRFRLPSAGRVTLSVYNAAGQRVRRLADGHFPSGQHALVWNGRDEREGIAASGIYFCRLQGDGFYGATKMMLLR